MQDKRIPLAWSVRWRRLRLQAIPVASFLLAVIACGWLWQERGAAVHGIGEVDALRIDVTSPRTGLVTALPHKSGGQWTLYDHVLAGDIIARFDDRQTQLDKEVLQAEVAELFARIAQWQIDSAAAGETETAESIRRASEYERSRLAAMEQALVGTVDIGVQDAVAEATDDAPKLPESISEATRLAFTQLRHARGSLELRWKEIKLQSEQLEIRAPISGTLVAVYCWPGQTVHQGALVATIAADHGRHIVSYLPEESRLQPTKGMRVTVRPRFAGIERITSEVEQVGRQIRRIPTHQLGGAATDQWGLPVRIKLPTGAALQPGALVDVVFHRQDKAPDADAG